LLIVLLAGCTAYRIAGQVQAGRQALLINDDETALAYFQQAAESFPDYIFESGSFREGVWTYLGRAQYQMGRLPDARRSLEGALMVDENDDLARLYLGLTLARGGDRSTALNAIVNGLKGLRGSLEYWNASDPFRAFWDPGRKIRGEIEKALAMIAGKDIDWGGLISRAEWVGREMEEEVDRVRRDETQWFRDQDQGIRSGASIGVGIGF
jgi:tetratricopeptide (TPR) repeat protein